MGPPLPEDPYAALGVAKDASAATIKTQYRKLVLKCHPDKVQDEAQKALAVDHFHKIQTAYEIIGDEDRRSRYDAQVKLAQLREDVMKRQSAAGARTAEVRTTTNKAPPTQHSRGSAYFPRDPERTAKVSPQYEERKPAYAAQYPPPDYFDSAPRPTPQRKDSEFERSSKRPAAPRRESERVKLSPKDVKGNERARQKERSRTEREVNRSRDRRQPYAGVAGESDSDEQEIWRRRKMREEDLRRAYHQEAQAPTQTQKQDARRSYYDSDERQRKVASQADAAREHIDSRKRRSEPERRPSPVRMGSSKEKMAPKKSEREKPGLFFRWGAGKPKPATRDNSDRTAERRAEREAAREEHRRSSADEVEGYRRGTTADELRRPPNLQHSKSSPAGMHTPEEPRLRAQSAQVEPQEAAATTTTTPPRVRRAETMPNVPGRERDARWRETLPRQASGLRQTEVVDGLATPATTPEYPEVKPAKYQYRREYADDTEFATPEGYRTEERMPDRAPQAAPTKAKRHTRSPSPPIRGFERASERPRDRPRTASARYPPTSPPRPAMPRTTSTSYVYKNGAAAEARPVYGREDSGRAEERLYGEIPRTRSTRSPRQDTTRSAAPEPDVTYRETPRYRAEDVRMASGYNPPKESRRHSMAVPRATRTNSAHPVYVRV